MIIRTKNLKRNFQKLHYHHKSDDGKKEEKKDYGKEKGKGKEAIVDRTQQRKLLLMLLVKHNKGKAGI